MRYLYDGAFCFLIMRSVFFIILLGVCVTCLAPQRQVMAQNVVSTKVEIESIDSDTTLYLGDWVVASSIRLRLIENNTALIGWEFNSEAGLLFIPISILPITINESTILIEFESLPISIPKNFQINQRIEFVDSDSNRTFPRIINENEQQFDSELQQSGSLSRGVIVGSNQDFALESGLQFELNGQLTEDVYLDAVLTDQNIPIQPDGTTQSIREFDKVLIRLRSDKASLEMGDVDVSLQQSTFGQLNRRLQGASGTVTTRAGDAKVALSTVRGTFRTQQFQGSDGVQGPYRLRDKNEEEFIIVLAGTERVYINGNQISRGEENEYIIDYGLGEITFTDNVFMKDETRIYVEFEYIDQDFTRTLIAGEANELLFDDRLELGISVIRQADGDDLLSQQALSEQDIRFLEQLGDDLDNAIVSGVISNPDDTNINIKYARVDTVYEGEAYQIFKNIPGSIQSNLVVRFSSVGFGNGSYRRIGDAINGLLYEWVGPGNGSYEPFRRLPAPEKHQMIALNSKLKITNRVSWNNEIALSDLDKNRFSTLNNEDNRDLAFSTDFSMDKIDVGFADLDLSVSHRQSGENFQFFERTREVEFDRKWNVNANNLTGEKESEVSTQLHFEDHSLINASYGRLVFSGFESNRQQSSVNVQESEKINISYKQEYISTTQTSNFESSWFRQLGNFSLRPAGHFAPFMHFEHEDQRERESGGLLLSSSQQFYEVGPGLSFENNTVKLSAAVVFREEQGVRNSDFEKIASSIEQKYQFNYIGSDQLRSENRIQFRTKEFQNSSEIIGSNNQNGVQIQSTTTFNQGEKFNSRFTYRASTQRQAIRQEAYINVGPEIGQFVWIDENENGIEEINEFFPELSPNEGTYVLQFLPSDELLSVIDLNTRFILDWAPFQLKEESNVSGWLSSLRLNTLVDIRENSISNAVNDVYLLRLNSFRNDSTTISGLIRLEQEVEIEPSEKSFLSITANFSDQLNRRASELQNRTSSTLRLNSTYQLNELTKVQLESSISNSKLLSDQITSRTFDIESINFNPGFTRRLSRSFQYGMNAGYSRKRNSSETRVTARILKSQFTFRSFLWQKIQASGFTEIRSATLSGDVNSYTRFELTEGTGEGTNFVWSFTANYRFNSLIRLNFTYDGRTVKNRPDIHTIKMVVSAVF